MSSFILVGACGLVSFGSVVVLSLLVGCLGWLLIIVYIVLLGMVVVAVVACGLIGWVVWLIMVGWVGGWV